MYFFNWHWMSVPACPWSPCRSCFGRPRASTPRTSWTTFRMIAPMHAAVRWMLAWGPRVLATLPLLGAALGIWLSRSTIVGFDDIEDEDIPETLKGHPQAAGRPGAASSPWVPLVCLVLAVLVFIAGRRCSSATWRRSAAAACAGSRSLNNWLLFPLFILASIGLLIYNPVWLPQQLGSIPIFALWMANLAVLFALFWRYSRIIGFPILAALIVALLIAFELSGRTDNHQFRHQPFRHRKSSARASRSRSAPGSPRAPTSRRIAAPASPTRSTSWRRRAAGCTRPIRRPSCSGACRIFATTSPSTCS